MVETTLWLCAALALIFVINLVPAFMPSSWMVMAFFHIKFGIPLLALTIPGAIVSGFGRLLLARSSGAFGERFMRDKQSDLQELGELLDEHRRVVAPAVFVYSLSPLPTNNLFVAAGMAGVNMAWVLVGFWAARIIADTFWVWTTNAVFQSLDDLFSRALNGPVAIGLQLLSVVSILLLYKLPWARWLRRLTGGAHSATATAAAK